MLFEYIVAVYNEKNTKPMNTKYCTTLQTVKVAGTYNHNWDLKGYIQTCCCIKDR